ncbi:hypothetical protein ACOZ4I_19500 (plasmid) [Haloarcula salina]|uniref:hypothetical protein n=1 Tax=Haloarcula salina TaxID=1429914 RepID=UPI003C6EC4E7
MAATVSGTARADSDCVSGPFERTYEAETINVSKIANGRKEREESDKPVEDPPSDEQLENMKQGNEEIPPAASAQQVPDSNGLLDIGTEYDGIGDAFVLSGAEGRRVAMPSDAQVAVGRSKTVQVVNSSLAIFNQRSGNIELQVPLENMFDPVITEERFLDGMPKVVDPRVRYDPNADRFVVSTLWRHYPTVSGAMFLAVSDSSNPNGPWHLYRISVPIDIPGFTDYPVLGLDRDAIYLTELFIPDEFALGNFDVTLTILDKQAAYRGDNLPASNFTGLFLVPITGGVPLLHLTVQPAFQPFSGGDSGTYYLMASQTHKQVFFDIFDTGLTLWKVTDPLDEPSVTCSVITVDPFSGLGGSDPAIDGVRQPDTDVRVDPVGDRLMNLDYSDGSLWTAHATKYNWEDGPDEYVTAIRWYEIDPTTTEVLQSGTYGEPGTSYFIPRIETSGDRTLLGYNVSGPDTYPSIKAAGRTTDVPDGEMEDVVVIQEGKSPMEHPTKFSDRDPVKWGDYMGISVHPKTDHFWMTGQYSPDYDVPQDSEKPDQYGTRIAEITFEDEDARGDRS